MHEQGDHLPLLLIAGCIFAGIYGGLHDQISYTVSPDYYHAFKFKQFDIRPELQTRVGAAIVGWQASWWMGVLIGLPLLLVGLILPGWKMYLTRSLLAFGVVTVTALVVGLGRSLLQALRLPRRPCPTTGILTTWPTRSPSRGPEPCTTLATSAVLLAS